MRIATFNILHGRPVAGAAEHAAMGTDHDEPAAANPGPLIESARMLESDVIALQEVDVDQPRSGFVNQPQVVADAIGAVDLKFVPTVIGTPGGAEGFRSTTKEERADEAATGRRYGIAIVSKLPVLQWHSEVFAPAPISMPLLVQTDGKPRYIKVRDEQRGALAATFEGPNGPVTIATAHLSFVPGYNVSQLRRLKVWLAALPRPLVLMGDFNLPWPVPRTLTKWEPLAKQPTYPSYKPRIQFDHILGDGLSERSVAAALARSEALRLRVSDHCALRTHVDFQ